MGFCEGSQFSKVNKSAAMSTMSFSFQIKAIVTLDGTHDNR